MNEGVNAQGRDLRSAAARTVFVLSLLLTLAGIAIAPAGAADPDRQLEFGDSVQGRDLRAYRVGPKDADRVVLVIGSFHGDEDEGHEIVARLRDESPNTFAMWLVTTVEPRRHRCRTSERTPTASTSIATSPSAGRRTRITSSGYYPGPEAVLRARVPGRQAARQADRPRPLDLLPPAVEPGPRLVQGPRPRAAPLREPREHGVRMPRRRPARHRDEVVQPQARPPRIRGRTGSRRAVIERGRQARPSRHEHRPPGLGQRFRERVVGGVAEEPEARLVDRRVAVEARAH